MAVTRVLYGTKVGEPEWMEEIITDNARNMQPAADWASRNGYDRLRIARYVFADEQSTGQNQVDKKKTHTASR